MDKTLIQQRLNQLRQESSAGEEQLRALQQRERELQNTLLRIKGAIQVLEEVLQEQETGKPV